jgi:hypothetical protein
MSNNVSNVHRTPPLTASGNSAVQGEIGGRRVQVGGGAHQRHFLGRAGQKISNFFRALGAAPQSLRQRIVEYKETWRAARTAAVSSTAGGQRAALLDRLPAGLSISDAGVISGRAVAGAIGTGDCVLTKEFAGKPVHEMIQLFGSGKRKNEKIGRRRSSILHRI